MKDYIVMSDSCVDLDAKTIEALGIEVLNLKFTLDGDSYANWPDGREIGFHEFYEKLRAGGSSSTSQVSVTEFIDAFEPHLEDGRDVLYLGFSSGLSGTVNSAQVAAGELVDKYPGNRVVVADTLAASMGQGLLVWLAMQEKKKKNLGIDQLAAWVEDNRLNLAHWFTVDDLNFLKRGGRLSGAAALLGTMLSIKPVLHVDNEGHLIAMEKVRGRKQSLNALVNHMEAAAIEPAGQTVFISHGDCLEDAEYVAAEVRRRFGVKDIDINFIGPVIGSHSGPGTVALFYVGIER